MKVNGKEIIFKENTTVEGLLDELKINKDNVVVEINLDILENSQYSEYVLREDDVIEVIRFVGGG
ncbi:sulfur carrier protein ThiS [Paraclostridium bifermentans]|uniref:sulfur carrier protein ThiS n=1 Tax=Paraclostridium bifermentans TaxID=1490 RepID=UPI00359CA178